MIKFKTVLNAMDEDVLIVNEENKIVYLDTLKELEKKQADLKERMR